MFKRLLIAAGLWFALALQAQATVAAVAAGHNNGTTATITIGNGSGTGAADIPAGSVILVAVSQGAGALSGTVPTDSASNTYTLVAHALMNASSVTGDVGLYISTTGNAVALTGVGHIDATNSQSAGGKQAGVSVAYVTGAAASPVDTGVTNTATGKSTPGTVTALAGAAVANSLFVGVSGTNGSTMTQDGTYSSTIVGVSATGMALIGGTKVASGSQSYAPATGGSIAWGSIITALAPPAAASATRFRTLLGVGQ